MLKIFHTGDNHLDSRFSSLSPSAREKERERQRSLFVKMVKYAKENEYDILLISGDLFDSSEVSPETASTVRKALADFGRPVVISPGNHDPYRETAFYLGDLPENVYLFNSTELQAFDIEELDLRVWGYAFAREILEESVFDGCNIPEFDGIQLICAHADLGAQSSDYAPVSQNGLDQKFVAYAALGHIHKLTPPFYAGKTLVSYCGFPEGRAFDEEGLGGAMSVTIDQNTVRAERVVFAERAYYKDELDISGVCSDEELIDRIKCYITHREYTARAALRLELVGLRDAAYLPNRELCRSVIAPALMSFELTDSSVPEIDTAELEGDYALRGEVYRTLLPKLSSDDAHERKIATEALAVALAAIDGRRIM